MRRARVFIPANGGAGGGPGPGTATLMWGPSFGQSAGHDGTSFDTQAAIDLDSINMVGALASQGAIDLANVDLTGALASQTVIDLTNIDLVGALAANQAIARQYEITRMDSSDDSWIEQANGDTNHGTDTDLEVRSDNALGNGEEQALVEFDAFSGISGVSASGSSDFIFYASESALLGSVDIELDFETFASDPFDESTVTWNNQPSGTVQFSKTVSVSGASFAEYTVSLTAGEIDSLLGNYVMVRFSNDNTIDRPQLLVKSKEATSTQRPRFEGINLS